MRMKFAAANNNLYGITNPYYFCVETPTLGFRRAGLIRPPEPYCALIPKAAAATPYIPMLQNESFAYCYVIGLLDSHGNLTLSEPSPIVKVKAPANGNYRIRVSGDFTLDVTQRHFFRVYRTRKSAANVDPGNEFFLTSQNSYNDFFGSTFFTLEDSRIDLLLGPPLYSNETVEGFEYVNGRIPQARALAWWQNHMFLFNLTPPQSREISVIGTRFTAGQSLTIGGVTYVVKDTTQTDITLTDLGEPIGEDAVNGIFVNYKDIADVGTRIEGIARSLCRVVNHCSSNGRYYAYYAGDPQRNPGRIIFVERGLSSTPFDFYSATLGANFEPQLPTTANTLLSTAVTQSNYAKISKTGQPEHFPPSITTFPVGEEDNPIINAHPTRDALIIEKQKGVWICTGRTLNDFSFRLLDPTIEIRDRGDSAALLNDTVRALSSEGPVTISATGVTRMGAQEQRNILFGTTNSPDNFRSVGIGHDAMGLYLVSTIDPELYQEQLNNPSRVTYPFSTFAYQDTGGQWSRCLFNASCFTVKDDLLYMGLNTPNGTILKQRVNAVANSTNFYDEISTVNIAAINAATKTVTLTFTPAVDYGDYFQGFPALSHYGYGTLGYGWVIRDGNRQYVVLSYNSGTGTAVLNRVDNLTVGSKNVLRPIPVMVAKNLFAGDSPQNIKKYQQVSIVGNINNAYELFAEFYSDMDFKPFPHYYSYFSYDPAAYAANVKRVTVPLLNPVRQEESDPARDIRDANDQRFYDRYIRFAVHNERLEGEQLTVMLVNMVAGASFSLRSFGFQMAQEETMNVDY